MPVCVHENRAFAHDQSDSPTAIRIGIPADCLAWSHRTFEQRWAALQGGIPLAMCNVFRQTQKWVLDLEIVSAGVSADCRSRINVLSCEAIAIAASPK